MQLFHTGNPQLKWGLRTLEDIPMGRFVCSYVGRVYTEMSAEMVWSPLLCEPGELMLFVIPPQKAQQHGDEYFADLDYIGKAQ